MPLVCRREKDESTTQAALGFKICGMQVYRHGAGGYWRVRSGGRLGDLLSGCLLCLLRLLAGLCAVLRDWQSARTAPAAAPSGLSQLRPTCGTSMPPACLPLQASSRWCKLLLPP